MVPFAPVSEFHAIDIVFCNLECCLYGRAVGMLSSTRSSSPTSGLRRSGAFSRHRGGRPRQQCKLQRGRDHGVDRPARRGRGRLYRRRRQPGNCTRRGDPEAGRDALRLCAAQLGLLAENFVGWCARQEFVSRHKMAAYQPARPVLGASLNVRSGESSPIRCVFGHRLQCAESGRSAVPIQIGVRYRLT